jgi:ArsR family transcriptional regulator
VSASASAASPRPAGQECLVPPAAPADPLVPDDVALALMAKALGHPARVAILRLLVQRGACVTSDVVAKLPLAQSTISEHLRILREAGLIHGEIDGPRTRYCVDGAGLAALRAGIAAL